MKKPLLFIVVIAILTLCSCGGAGYAHIGKKFLDKAFNFETIEAKELMSSGLDIYDKDDILDFVRDIIFKYELYNSTYKFKYRSGYYNDRISLFDYATGFYSVNDEKLIIVVDLCKNYNDEWCVENIGVYDMEEFLEEYLSYAEKLKEAKENGDANKIEKANRDFETEAKIIKSFRKFFSKEQWETVMKAGK